VGARRVQKLGIRQGLPTCLCAVNNRLHAAMVLSSDWRVRARKRARALMRRNMILLDRIFWHKEHTCVHVASCVP
jgi:hypothetical protein